MNWTNIDRKKLLANIFDALHDRDDIIQDIILNTPADEQYLVREFFNTF